MMISALLCLSLTVNSTTMIFPPQTHTMGIQKATPELLRTFIGDKVAFNNPQGIAATRLVSWDDPSRTADDDELTVYGVNSGANCIVYNTSMQSLDVYYNEEAGGFSAPMGIAALPDGKVFVADADNKRIVELYNPGKKLSFVREIGLTVLENPVDVSIANDLIFVADAAKNAVIVFNTDGSVSHIIENIPNPTAIAVTSTKEYWSMARKDLIYVVFDMGHRVMSMNHMGEKLAEVWLSTIPNSQKLGYCALDLFNNLYVTDTGSGMVHKFDIHLNYLDSVGETGVGDYQFNQPRGIAIWRRFGQIFLTEATGAQYYWIGTDIKNLEAYKDTSEVLVISFKLTETASVKANILNDAGRSIAEKDLEIRLPGDHFVRWSLSMELNPNVQYMVSFEATPYYGSKNIFTAKEEAPITFINP
jgi:hypothetical protein